MGLFGKLFGSGKEREPVDLSVLKTDVHSHLIPGIDDGAKNMEDALDLIRGLVDLGYSKLITTPHIMSDYYKNTPEIILSGRDKVREALVKHNIDIPFDAAAEYYIDDSLEAKIKKKELLTFGDNYVLFEMPFISEPPNVGRIAFEMQMAGYKPVLAHVERYAFWHQEYEKYEQMQEKGVILQLNMNSLSGHYGPGVKKIAERLIKEERISIVSSDCHHEQHILMMDQTRTNPYLHQLLEKNLINQEL